MIKAEKQVIGILNKCYAVAKFDYDGEEHLICAAEKQDPCYVYTLDGKQVEKLWDGPGGVMTLLALTGGTDPVLLSTQKFYSPNDSAQAKIVYYTRKGGAWQCGVLCDLPFVHRFGIVTRGGKSYLVACTLKSAHAFKNDWTCPGRVWVAPMPEDVREYNAENQLQMTPLISGLYKNHGFSICEEGDYSSAIVGTENGIFRVVPPETEGGEWAYEQLTCTPASDMLYLDFDGDGERELLVISPFHGDTLTMYKKQGESFISIWEAPEKMPFLHAIWGAKYADRQVAFIGNREDQRNLLAVYCDGSGNVVTDLLDQGAGAANCMFFKRGGEDMLLASNRESNEVALYRLYEE